MRLTLGIKAIFSLFVLGHLMQCVSSTVLGLAISAALFWYINLNATRNNYHYIKKDGIKNPSARRKV